MNETHLMALWNESSVEKKAMVKILRIIHMLLTRSDRLLPGVFLMGL